MIIVEKPNGKNSDLPRFKTCKSGNKMSTLQTQAIRCQHYKLSTAEELFSGMHNANFFTKLDVSSDYWQVQIDEELSKLLTFLTHFRILWFKHLPYEMHSASEVF